MGARYYDAIAGRFLSPDPLGHAASMDLYNFANGDPINFVDPTGRYSVEFAEGIAAAYAADPTGYYYPGTPPLENPDNALRAALGHPISQASGHYLNAAGSVLGAVAISPGDATPAAPAVVVAQFALAANAAHSAGTGTEVLMDYFFGSDVNLGFESTSGPADFIENSLIGSDTGLGEIIDQSAGLYVSVVSGPSTILDGLDLSLQTGALLDTTYSYATGSQHESLFSQASGPGQYVDLALGGNGSVGHAFDAATALASGELLPTHINDKVSFTNSTYNFFNSLVGLQADSVGDPVLGNNPDGKK